MPAKKKASSEPEKRPVLDYHRYGYGYEPRFDKPLAELLGNAALMGDAEELMECLRESPRFKRHLCVKAERDVAEQRKALEEAERKMREACHIGGKP